MVLKRNNQFELVLSDFKNIFFQMQNGVKSVSFLVKWKKVEKLSGNQIHINEMNPKAKTQRNVGNVNRNKFWRKTFIRHLDETEILKLIAWHSQQPQNKSSKKEKEKNHKNQTDVINVGARS